MYMILWWSRLDDYLNCVSNIDGSIRLFESLKEADKFADESNDSHHMRVISINAVM